jgi:hypothetical protein
MRMIVIARQNADPAKISQGKVLAMSNEDGHGKNKAKSLDESIQRTTGAILGGGCRPHNLMHTIIAQKAGGTYFFACFRVE